MHTALAYSLHGTALFTALCSAVQCSLVQGEDVPPCVSQLSLLLQPNSTHCTVLCVLDCMDCTAQCTVLYSTVHCIALDCNTQYCIAL